MSHLSVQMLEAIDGALVPIFLFMLTSALMYFYRAWRDDGYRWRRPSVEVKGAFAAVMLFLGISIKKDLVWYWRHMVNHNETILVLGRYANVVLIASLALTIIGAVLWVRTVMPIGCSRWAWAYVTVGSLIFGVWLAL